MSEVITSLLTADWLGIVNIDVCECNRDLVHAAVMLPKDSRRRC